MGAIVIDGDLALRLLTEVVEGNEDYIDPNATIRCHYIEDGAPACIIGKALSKAGVSNEQLGVLDHYVGPIHVVSIDNPRVTEFELTTGARVIFRAAQKRQDRGSSWGTALADARYAAGIRD